MESCDADDDHRISLMEWGKCLGLEEGDFEDRCEEILGNKEAAIKTNEAWEAKKYKNFIILIRNYCQMALYVNDIKADKRAWCL